MVKKKSFSLTISLKPYKPSNTLRKSLQTTLASPYRTQVQLTASFLVCFLIFIEYKNLHLLFFKKSSILSGVQEFLLQIV